MKRWLAEPPWWARHAIVTSWRWWEGVRGGRSVGSTEPSWCRALAGESHYNLCVNSDMTVSCNCQDYDGSGHIGTMETHTLSEILASPLVRTFQESLLRGQHPTPVCGICIDRVPASPSTTIGDVFPGHFPQRGLMIENTSACNLACAECDRPAVAKLRTRKLMSLDEVALIAQQCADGGVEQIFYYSLGEPFASPRIREEMQVVRDLNPQATIYMSTNAGLIDTDAKREAALLMDHITVSLDGVDQATVARYQCGLDFDAAYANLAALCAYRDEHQSDEPGARRTLIEWKYLLFAWNDHPDQIATALELASKAGVDQVLFSPGFTTEPHGMSWRYFYDRSLRGGTWRVDNSVVIWLTDLARELRRAN